MRHADKLLNFFGRPITGALKLGNCLCLYGLGDTNWRDIAKVVVRNDRRLFCGRCTMYTKYTISRIDGIIIMKNNINR